MPSDDLIAIASDALRGLLQSALPTGVPVVIGAPEDTGAGLWVHLLRISVADPSRQATSGRDAVGHRRGDVHLRMDYLIAGAADEALQAHALLGAALRVIDGAALVDRGDLGARLSQAHRLTAMPPGELSVHWRLLDLSLAEQASIWTASAASQRAGVFVQGDIAWLPAAVPGPAVLDVGALDPGDREAGAHEAGVHDAGVHDSDTGIVRRPA